MYPVETVSVLPSALLNLRSFLSCATDMIPGEPQGKESSGQGSQARADALWLTPSHLLERDALPDDDMCGQQLGGDGGLALQVGNARDAQR